MGISKSTQQLVKEALNLIKEENPTFYEVNKKGFTSSQITKEFFQLRLAGLEREVFEIAFLDNAHKLIECDQMFKGTIDAASVYPREVAKKALLLNASAVIFAHNHPSGTAEPSIADKQITTRLIEGLKLFDIQVLDHLIVGKGVYSFAENGLI